MPPRSSRKPATAPIPRARLFLLCFIVVALLLLLDATGVFPLFSSSIVTPPTRRPGPASNLPPTGNPIHEPVPGGRPSGATGGAGEREEEEDGMYPLEHGQGDGFAAIETRSNGLTMGYENHCQQQCPYMEPLSENDDWREVAAAAKAQANRKTGTFGERDGADHLNKRQQNAGAHNANDGAAHDDAGDHHDHDGKHADEQEGHNAGGGRHVQQAGADAKSPSRRTKASAGRGKQDTMSIPCYSSFRCADAGDKETFVSDRTRYAFTIVNRSCVYENVLFDPSKRQFHFFAPMDAPIKDLPPVNLASRPIDLPAVKGTEIARSKYKPAMWFRAVLKRGRKIPCDVPRDTRTLAYYVPIVAPWNFAHTLFCDLFSLFWAMWELRLPLARDVQVVVQNQQYAKRFTMPNSNKAFELFSTRLPRWDKDMPPRVYRRLVVGGGTKTWSWVTEQYSAAGSPGLWYAFRKHVMAVVGAIDRPGTAHVFQDTGKVTLASGKQVRVNRKSVGHLADENQNTENQGTGKKRRIRVSICHKKDKRGVMNYAEITQHLRSEFNEDAEFVLESAVGRSARGQVQMMLDADVYMCNEGTLATVFFLMRPGSAFVSLPLVFHHPHLHQKSGVMPEARQWWRQPDPLRPDPRKKVGGNIDWFPPSIPWVSVYWYDRIPLNETQIQIPLQSLRNYMPEMNLVLQPHRLDPIMRQAIDRVRRADSTRAQMQALPSAANDESKKSRTADPLAEKLLAERPNYSVSANICRQMLLLQPNLTASFNSAYCFISMSWLCEFWANSQYRWRTVHPKWQRAKGRCGDAGSSIQALRAAVRAQRTALAKIGIKGQTIRSGVFTDERTQAAFELAVKNGRFHGVIPPHRSVARKQIGHSARTLQEDDKAVVGDAAGVKQDTTLKDMMKKAHKEQMEADTAQDDPVAAGAGAGAGDEAHDRPHSKAPRTAGAAKHVADGDVLDATAQPRRESTTTDATSTTLPPLLDDPVDPRDAWPISEFLFFSKSDLQRRYTSFDFTFGAPKDTVDESGARTSGGGGEMLKEAHMDDLRIFDLPGAKKWDV